MDDIDDIRRRVTVYDVLVSLGIEATLRRAGCPVCSGTLELHVSAWECTGCRAGGDGIDLTSHIAGCTRTDAITWLLGRRRQLDWKSKSARQRALARTRRMEDICADYGLPLTETDERPYPWVWRGDGLNLATPCSRCNGPLLICIKTTLQVWTCRECRAGWVDAEDSIGFQAGDSIALVRFLTRSTFNHAVWYLGGGGPKPSMR